MRERVKVGLRPDYWPRIMLLSSIVFLFASGVIRLHVLHAVAAVSRGTIHASVDLVTPATHIDKAAQAAPSPVAAFEDAKYTKMSVNLDGQLSGWAKQQPARQQWAIVVRSLDDANLDASLHADTSFGSASIFKLYLVYGLDKLLPYAKWQTQHIDSTRTYADCVQAMMVRSDNQCAIEIGNKLGWNKVSNLLVPAGYTHTSLKADPTPTTAADTAQLLADLYQRHGFSDGAASFMLQGMSHSVFRKGIVAGCPDCQVANKTGDANGFLHDTAIITVNGKHYVLVIFSHGGSQAQIAAVTRLIRQTLN